MLLPVDINTAQKLEAYDWGQCGAITNISAIDLARARATFAESFVAKEPFAGPILSIGPPFGEVGTNL